MENNLIEIQNLLEEKLLPYVDRDYAILDLPYHPNVGDSLIALAALDFLKKSGHKLSYSCSMFTYDDREIPETTLIVFNGGGNFGDLWRPYTADFRNKIIRRFPNHHYLVLPQSVCYKDEDFLEEEVKLYSACGKNITICARDKVSYDFLKEHFTQNTIVLVPDMAFVTNSKYLKCQENNGRILFLRRKDKEIKESTKYGIVPKEAEIRDWPTMEKYSKLYEFYYRANRYIERKNIHIPNFLKKIENKIWQKFILPYNRKDGIKFVNRYDIVYTTRLHVAIIAVLLNKQVYFFDNSYGKNSALYNTWLTDFENIKLI